MANSKYASTLETTNLARVARIIFGPCTDVLCAVLTKEICPSTLSHKVKIYLANLPKRKEPPITKEQERLIYSGNSSYFDITLLYFLLRNISKIPPHRKQWGNDPDPSDRSVSANIERVRLIRNKYGHCPDISLSNTDFNKKVTEILNIIGDIENYLGTATIYQDAVVKIRTYCMDPEQESRYIKELLNLNKKIQEISGTFLLKTYAKRYFFHLDFGIKILFFRYCVLELLTLNISLPTGETKRIENTCVPKNVKGNYFFLLFYTYKNTMFIFEFVQICHKKVRRIKKMN